LLENAFKFVSFRMKKPSLNISLVSNGGTIEFEISNYYEINQGIKGNKDSGYGIVNLKRRLELIYPEKHRLEIEDHDQLFRVKLTIDTHGDQMRGN
jgi:hypothetical protein